MAARQDEDMRFGTLDFLPAAGNRGLLAPPTSAALADRDDAVLVAAIDPDLADTQAFCDHYEIAVEAGANCVIVEAKRAERTWYAACLVLGSDKVDVNGVVRKHLGAKKASFAATETATALTGMEYGGINPIGIPADWPVLVDEAVAAGDHLVIGSGIRGSKLLVTGAFLAALPNAEVLPIARRLNDS
jgi:prolyl-tRNA editing enzyme YbaK/EbsC (Cys-tRNA(Pro) deacylase)